ncbi:hypothetical protein F5Y00DRAFT_257438 [Daldinia vernicosa]|uniref:uncharacterized protein n=1 Tax=Daldinia vernicosa TaxID=114800 RepID=UPI002008A751|nr:uncharacterized protein F5Y00DRAFT_257438 [Daldinia vernicosa]KAI0853414.1 hypothetical protein F5Y00DRAFT_257438 [Daldinia vernicosa]
MQLKLLALLGALALAPIASAQNNTIVVIDNLVEIINIFPKCSLQCLSDVIDLNRCRVADLECICHWDLHITDNLSSCMTRGPCKGTHNDVRARVWDFCHRFDENPPAEEVEAARKLMRERIKDQSDYLDHYGGGSGTAAGPGTTVVGAVVAAAAALII